MKFSELRKLEKESAKSCNGTHDVKFNPSKSRRKNRRLRRK
jgi:hypothetical protein